MAIASDASVGGSTKNIALLSISQAIVGSQQALIMAIAALVGFTMAPDPALATVPVTSMVLGLALTAGLAALAIHRLGRKRAFMLGATVSVLAGLLVAMAIVTNSFVLFCISLAIAGAAAAFGQQYRFAAADSVAPAFKGKAISWVMAGGVFAGFIGPGLSYLGRYWIPGAEYAGSFIAMSGLALVGVAILSQTNLAKAELKKKNVSSRPFSEIVKAPEVFVPIFSGMASYALMTFVMVAAPLAMVIVCGHTNEQATTAIQWHIVSMFAPSFITGSIIARIGARATTGLGLTIILASALISLNGTSVWHFDFALILLGVGWNFGFIGSTALLAQGYRPEDAAKVQALNEQMVFGVMAIASISSGVLLQTIGWQSINVMVIPIATAAIAMLAWGEWHGKKADLVEKY